MFICFLGLSPTISEQVGACSDAFGAGICAQQQLVQLKTTSKQTGMPDRETKQLLFMSGLKC